MDISIQTLTKYANRWLKYQGITEFTLSHTLNEEFSLIIGNQEWQLMVEIEYDPTNPVVRVWIVPNYQITAFVNIPGHTFDHDISDSAYDEICDEINVNDKYSNLKKYPLGSD